MCLSPGAAGNACGFQRGGICNGHVTGNVNKENGILRRHRIEILPRGKSFLGPKRVVPAGTSNPFAGFRLGYGRSEAFLYFLNHRCPVQPHGQSVLSCAAKMNVSIVEPGHDEVAFEVHNLRSLFAQRCNFVFVSDGEDNFAANKHCRCPR